MSISTRALDAAWALSSSNIMQLHSGSGFLMEDFALELELVEFVPAEETIFKQGVYENHSYVVGM